MFESSNFISHQIVKCGITKSKRLQNTTQRRVWPRDACHPITEERWKDQTFPTFVAILRKAMKKPRLQNCCKDTIKLKKTCSV